MTLPQTPAPPQARSAPDAAPCRAAMDYAARGWCVLPCLPRQKKPAVKAWQTAATTDQEIITDWWTRRPQCNVGVQLGPRSGIIDVECDSEEAERELGALLGDQAPVVPTYQARRGKHRLFCWSPDLPHPDKAVFTFRGVEFRTGSGKGAQSLFPPSIHPDGPTYTWLVSPDEADPAPLPPSVLAVLSNLRATQRAQRTQTNTEDTEDTEDTEHRLRPLCPLAPSAPSVLQAIEATLPTGPGQRRRRIFDLCRRLKAIPALASADAQALRPVVVEWHNRALPFIGTKPFTETWADFAEGWPRVKHPAGQGVVEAAFARAAAAAPPPRAVELYGDEGAVVLLASLCRELQRVAGDGPFYLDCRTAGRLVGVHHTTAWRLLTVVFRADGVLEAGAKGAKATRRANEYRYVAD